MCMQKLSDTTLFSTYDLRLFSQLNWDLGSPVRQSEVLHPDEAFTGNPPPFSMVLNCAVLQQQLQPIFGGTNETSDGTAVGTNGTESSSGGPLDTYEARYMSVEIAYAGVLCAVRSVRCSCN